MIGIQINKMELTVTKTTKFLEIGRRDISPKKTH